ncbi:MAG TPA: tetratricopeptide repeat protein, partial [Candidatus Methylacidiphilales bacterium]|nr:tetratricopeptide repeat protein [Candidatus Methylacidiphilales bacterium]
MAKRFTKKERVVDSVFEPPLTTARKIASESPLPEWLKGDWMWGLLLVLAVFVTYTPVWWAGYIWDDETFVTANPCIVGPLGLKEIWTTSAADICPLTLTTVWFEHALWGLAPLPYHLVNVLLHAACAVLLWRVLLSLRVPGAWLGAALWALHPVQVESVAWITEMKNTQSGLFYLLSILFYVKWLRARDFDPEGEEKTSSEWNYELTLLFAVMAMASKSSTVVLPVVLCLCAWWIEGKWQWRNLIRIVPIVLISLTACALSIWTQGQQLGKVPDPQWARTWPERLITAGDAVWFYLGKLIWPHPLMAIYPRWQIDAKEWFAYLPLLTVIAVSLGFWCNCRFRFRPWLFTYIYFLIVLLPVIGLNDFYYQRFSFVADHFQYLASMGPLSLAGAGLASFSDRIGSQRLWLQWTPAVGMLLIFGILSWQRSWVYQNNETLWTDTVIQNPNSWLAHTNLGASLSRKGRVDDAIVEYQKALKINSRYDVAHFNLGIAFAHREQLDEAITEFQEALKI